MFQSERYASFFLFLSLFPLLHVSPSSKNSVISINFACAPAYEETTRGGIQDYRHQTTANNREDATGTRDRDTFRALPFSACTRAKRTFFVAPNSILIGTFACNFLGEHNVAKSDSLITVFEGWPVIAID